MKTVVLGVCQLQRSLCAKSGLAFFAHLDVGVFSSSVEVSRLDFWVLFRFLHMYCIISGINFQEGNL